MEWDILGEAACDNTMYFIDLLGDLLKFYIFLLKIDDD